MRDAMRGVSAAAVPCDGCVGCCASSQFVHVGPEETEALAAIPRDLLFPAPGLARGNVVMGYDQRGRCPMLVDDRCSIYAHRPRACRTYDCRVFAATGVDVGDDKPLVAKSARAWRFSIRSAEDRRTRDALRAAAAYLEEHGRALPEGLRPATPTQRAVLAVRIEHLFRGNATPSVQRVAAALARSPSPAGRRRATD